MKGQQEVLLVDVREEGRAEKLWIPGAIKIPLFALRTKTFLKGKPIVVFNEGHSYLSLNRECEVLSKSGFDVSVLDGGLRSWIRKGGVVEGDAFSRTGLNRLSPQMFAAGKENENWLIIDATGRAGHEISRKGREDLDSRAVRIPFTQQKGNQEFGRKLKPLVDGRKGKPFFSIVVIDRDGKMYDRMEKYLIDVAVVNVFYVDGGFEAYDSYKKQANLVAARGGKLNADTGGTRKKGCRSCR